MNIKKIIREETGDFDWVRDQLNDKFRVGSKFIQPIKQYGDSIWSKNGWSNDIVKYGETGPNSNNNPPRVFTIIEFKKNPYRRVENYDVKVSWTYGPIKRTTWFNLSDVDNYFNLGIWVLVYNTIWDDDYGDMVQPNQMNESDNSFDWVGNINPISTTKNGKLQGVVYLRTHGEITEFFDLIGGTYGIIGKRKTDIENTKIDFHNALDETIDRFTSDEWDGYDDWVPVISASFFISKKDPTKYITGYWDLDVSVEDVNDWLNDTSLPDKLNWRIYTNFSELKSLLNDMLTENFDMDWVDDIEPVTHWDMNNYYVLDVTTVSQQISEVVEDVWDFASEMGYDVELGVNLNVVGYIYFEPDNGVPEGYSLDWGERSHKNPTFDGKYRMISLDEFHYIVHEIFNRKPLT